MRAAAEDHWRVSGVVGQTTTTREMSPAASMPRAASRAGRVFPAPGAAEMRKGPCSQVAMACMALTCQGRRPSRL